MSISRHPVALRLERLVGGDARLLATVMALPLVDGIFPALVIAGALTVPFGIVETGLLIFGGSATVAVILAEMDGTRRETVRTVLLLGLVIIPLAAVEAALAPTIESLLEPDVFRRFAGLVIVAVAARTASARVGDLLPRPAIVIGLGMVAAFRPTDAALVVDADPGLIARAAAAAGVGVAFALGVALAGPRLRGAVDLDRFRFGSAVALGTLALSVLGLPVEGPVALVVLAVTALFAFDPGGDATPPSDPAVADGGEAGDGAEASADAADPGPDAGERERDRADADVERAPWL
jgi:hypothetical protein